jgi:hypothetical protein
MEFIAFPVPDGGVPASTRETMALAEAIVARLDEGKAVAVHCRAGIGRSSLIAACVLVLLGLAPGMAFDRIGKARGVKVPDTEGQRDWVDMFREATKTGGVHPARCHATRLAFVLLWPHCGSRRFRASPATSWRRIVPGVAL